MRGLRGQRSGAGARGLVGAGTPRHRRQGADAVAVESVSSQDSNTARVGLNPRDSHSTLRRRQHDSLAARQNTKLIQYILRASKLQNLRRLIPTVLCWIAVTSILHRRISRRCSFVAPRQLPSAKAAIWRATFWPRQKQDRHWDPFETFSATRQDVQD